MRGLQQIIDRSFDIEGNFIHEILALRIICFFLYIFAFIVIGYMSNIGWGNLGIIDGFFLVFPGLRSFSS